MKQVRYAFIGIVGIALMLGVVWLARTRVVPEKEYAMSSEMPSSLANADIIVDTPLSGTTVSYPIHISGKARGMWFFEAAFPVWLETHGRDVLAQSHAQAMSDWMTSDFVPFEATIEPGEPVGVPTSVILVLKKDNPSGLPQNDAEVRIPLLLSSTKIMHVQVFWGHEMPKGVGDQAAYDCSGVVGADRWIAQTREPARAALEQLLAGPTDTEKAQGLFTGLNTGIIIQKLSIQNGTVYVDFDKTLDQAVGGSCRVAAIRAQITKTLEQFPSVKNVVISIDGRTEDILQP